MFVWMAKFGAAYGVRTGIHVGVDVLINRLPGATRARSTCCSACSPAPRSPAIVGTLGATFIWDNGAHRAQAVARPRDAEMDRLSVHSARLVPDVLPLPAGRLAFARTGELPHHDVAHVEGIEDATSTRYDLADNLHPRRDEGGRP